MEINIPKNTWVDVSTISGVVGTIRITNLGVSYLYVRESAVSPTATSASIVLTPIAPNYPTYGVVDIVTPTNSVWVYSKDVSGKVYVTGGE